MWWLHAPEPRLLCNCASHLRINDMSKRRAELSDTEPHYDDHENKETKRPLCCLVPVGSVKEEDAHAHAHSLALTLTLTLSRSRSHRSRDSHLHDHALTLTRRRRSRRSHAAHTQKTLVTLKSHRRRSRCSRTLTLTLSCSCSHALTPHAHHTHPEAAETHALRGWRRQQNKAILSSRDADVGRRGRRGRGSRGPINAKHDNTHKTTF
jgi:hypothetical protein